jgi:hypothetical protein
MKITFVSSVDRPCAMDTVSQRGLAIYCTFVQLRGAR